MEIKELHIRQAQIDSAASLWNSLSYKQATNSKTVIKPIEKWDGSVHVSGHEIESRVLMHSGLNGSMAS